MLILQSISDKYEKKTRTYKVNFVCLVFFFFSLLRLFSLEMWRSKKLQSQSCTPFYYIKKHCEKCRRRISRCPGRSMLLSGGSTFIISIRNSGMHVFSEHSIWVKKNLKTTILYSSFLFIFCFHMTYAYPRLTSYVIARG